MEKRFLTDGTTTVVDNDVLVYGDVGAVTSEIVNAYGLRTVIDANVEKVVLDGRIGDYTFKQVTNRIYVYQGANEVGQVYLQDDANGTLLTFSNGTAQAKIGAGNVMTLAGAVVSSVENTTIVPVTGADWETAALSTIGKTFTLTASTVAGAHADTTLDIMGLTGDQVVRIDLTGNDNQVKGLDLNGNGVIDANGLENINPTTQDNGKDFEIVDAYARNRADESDLTHNYLGNIAYDGTGFAGDGVSTDGNIVLGGLGADTILGGIGNDFLVGGGVAANPVFPDLIQPNGGNDRLDGGRNADFFFAELSLLDNTDGNNLIINGGSTSDDAAVGNNTPQDSDWLLLEVSDDEDGTIVDLGFGINGDENNQSTTTGAGRTIEMTEVENVDASGNLYGFLNHFIDSDLVLGAAGGDNGSGEYVGIGSSAQLNIQGSIANNILIGGYDNDLIEGDEGNDLLFGGNLQYSVNNPNAAGITNDGRDELIGGSGDDNLVWEADGGIYEGQNDQDSETPMVEVDEDDNITDTSNDTLWLTSQSLGTGTTAMIDDGIVRLDLATGGGSGVAGGVDASAGYGGADAVAAASSSSYAGVWTADQSNYVAGVNRTQVQDVENVIATGLGAVDYRAAGMNDPDVSFNNQQNHLGYEGDLDLRGTEGANTLYANTGDDVIEGRMGNDLLSGGEGNDDFVFQLADSTGDGVDVIHRQHNLSTDIANANYNITDGTFEQDFGVDSNSEFGPSTLTVDFSEANLADANVFMGSFSVVIDGVTFAVADLTALAAVTTTEALAALADAAFSAQNQYVSVSADGDILTITDASPTGGGEFSDTQAEGYAVNITVNAPGTGTLGLPDYVAAGETVSQDRLIYASYEDRVDGELVDDNSYTGSTISLGTDAYAEDLVIDFADGSTRIAEDQSYTTTFENLTTEDTVAIDVNGVKYTLTVGVDLDGNELANEELVTQGGTAATQAAIQTNFLGRMEDFIDNFMDDDTAAGSVNAAATATTLTLTQNVYTDGEETVFMRSPTVVLTNASGGELATAVTVNNAQHEVLLLDFDGRNANLHDENALFIGDTGVSRAILATADDQAGGVLNGSDAIVIDGGSNTLQATVATTAAVIADNTATNSFLRADFAVHGDDFLIGGDALDTISGGTGDDRVHGSLGNDVIDGGKSFYAVRVLGEPQSRVFVLNQWESENPGEVTALDGLTITAISRIDDIEGGNAGPNNAGLNEVFQDTLQFLQNDFTTGDTRFTVTLNDFNFVGGQVQLDHGGAGTVSVDLDGNGGAFDSTTTFTNFENIRTISGTGNAVAGDGQGNDTLDITLISNVIDGASGVSYDLTNGANAGQVRYSANAHASLTNPAEADFESLMIRVDGVENVISGTGDDLLLIDETEAAKDNTFTASTGDDRIQYENDYDTAGTTPEPTVTIRVNTATDTDEVEMTAGRVGSTVATDTLTGVEIISLMGETAQGVREDDVLDVTAITAGAIVNYDDALITNDTAGTVAGSIRSLAGTLQLTVENMYEIENVIADGDDTVILASASVMSLNALTDVDGDDEAPIEINSFLNYDMINADDLTDRLSLVEIASGTEDVVLGGATDLPETLNYGQFRFSMSETGDGNDNDTIDYSQTVDSIAAVVNFDVDQDTQYVLVDGDGNATFDNINDDDADRVDEIVSAENIVAAQGESILDLTGADQNLRISFSNNYDNVADWNSTFNADYGREIHEIKVASATTGTSVLSMNYLDYKFIDTDTTDAVAAAANATWTSVEGSDFNETVDLSGWEADAVNTLNLRGGDNQVNYEGDSVAITINVIDYDENNPATTGLVSVAALHTAPGDDHNAATVDADVSATDIITSYSAQNEIATGSLTVKGARGDLDTISFAGGLGSKFFILGGITDATSSITVTIDEATAANSLELVGFETLMDAATDDTYRMDDLEQVQNDLAFVDNAADDRDTIQVFDDAIAYDGGPAVLTAAADTISLEVLNDVFGFDFDVLDITNVTDNNLLLVADDDDQDNDAILNASILESDYIGVGDTNSDGANDVARILTDDVIIGSVDLVDSILGFDNIWFTDASIASAGSTYELDIDAGELISNNVTNLITNTTGLNFSRVTSAVAVTVTDNGAAGAQVVGTALADNITGGAGDDTFTGGAGNDTLDGGVIPEVLGTLVFTLGAGDLGATTADGTVTITANGETIVISEAGTVTSSATGVITPVSGGIADGATAVAIADVIGALSLAQIEAGLGFTAGDLASVDVVTAVGAAEITFTFSAVYGDPAPADITMAIAAGTDTTNTIAVNGTLPDGAGDVAAQQAGNGVDYAASTESADTYVFAATAVLNGADTILNFDASDILDFTAFATDDAPVAEVADGSAGAVATADNDIYLVSDADGSINTVAEVLALFAVAGTPFSSTLIANAEFVIAIRDTQVDGDTTLWFIDNGDNTALASSEITLVGTLTDYNTALVDGNILN